jgi:hypothetical protein
VCIKTSGFSAQADHLGDRRCGNRELLLDLSRHRRERVDEIASLETAWLQSAAADVEHAGVFEHALAPALNDEPSIGRFDRTADAGPIGEERIPEAPADIRIGDIRADELPVVGPSEREAQHTIVDGRFRHPAHRSGEEDPAAFGRLPCSLAPRFFDQSLGVGATRHPVVGQRAIDPVAREWPKREQVKRSLAGRRDVRHRSAGSA